MSLNVEGSKLAKGRANAKADPMHANFEDMTAEDIDNWITSNPAKLADAVRYLLKLSLFGK